MKKDIKQEILQAREDLNKISINSEFIENYNKLIGDKLQELNKLDIQQSKNNLIIKIWQLKHYSECYLTINYSISDEIKKLNDNIKSIDDKIEIILEACKNDKK